MTGAIQGIIPPSTAPDKAPEIAAARAEICKLADAIGAALRRVGDHDRGPLLLDALAAIRRAGSEIDDAPAPRRRRGAAA